MQRKTTAKKIKKVNNQCISLELQASFVFTSKWWRLVILETIRIHISDLHSGLWTAMCLSFKQNGRLHFVSPFLLKISVNLQQRHHLYQFSAPFSFISSTKQNTSKTCYQQRSSACGKDKNSQRPVLTEPTCVASTSTSPEKTDKLSFIQLQIWILHNHFASSSSSSFEKKKNVCDKREWVDPKFSTSMWTPTIWKDDRCFLLGAPPP